MTYRVLPLTCSKILAIQTPIIPCVKRIIAEKNEIAIKMPADPKAVRSLNLACKVCIIKSSETKIEKIPKRTPIYRGFIE